MNEKILVAAYAKELETEAVATRKCLERIPENVFDFKPHPTSMPMGYLSLLVAEIPLWITYMVEQREIDFATFKHAEIKTNKELVAHFDENMEGAKKALQQASEENLQKIFSLKNKGQVIFSVPVIDYIAPTLSHWVHHRGQLFVYMRISGIAVPSIYGPSADDRQFSTPA